MRKSWATLALGAVLTLTALGTAPIAAAQQPGDLRVDLNLKDADLVAATRAITQKTGLQFVFEGSDQPFKPITLKIDAVTAEDAISYICQSAGAYFRRDPNGVYIISHTKPAPVADVPPIIGTTPPKVVRITKKIRLMKANPREVYAQLGGAVAMDEGLRSLQHLMTISSSELSQQIFGGTESVKNTTPNNLTTLPEQTRTYNTPQTAKESGNDIAIPGSEGAAQLGLGGGLGQGGGLGGQNGLGGGQNGLGGGQGNQNAQLRGGQGLVPSTITFISYDPTDNSLIVQGTSEDDIAELQRTISLFDQAPRQVQIKVEFITTTETLNRSLGYDFLYQRGPIFAGTAPGTFARTSDPVFLNYATGNISTRLRTQLAEGRGRVVSAPIIRTLNNQPAIINNTISTWVFTTQTTLSNGTLFSTVNPTQIQISTFLAVTPRINQDETVTVYLSPQIGNITGFTTGPDGASYPNLAFQSISVVARVRNGDTIVLGGLTTKNDFENVTRIPVLSDLPIIGQFFRGTVRNKNNSDLLIFVTPTIVEEEETGGG